MVPAPELVPAVPVVLLVPAIPPVPPLPPPLLQAAIAASSIPLDNPTSPSRIKPPDHVVDRRALLSRDRGEEIA
jgi:hypothetical protein